MIAEVCILSVFRNYSQINTQFKKSYILKLECDRTSLFSSLFVVHNAAGPNEFSLHYLELPLGGGGPEW